MGNIYHAQAKMNDLRTALCSVGYSNRRNWGTISAADWNNMPDANKCKNCAEIIRQRKPVGLYKPTSLDAQKEAADFLLLQVSPYMIRWRDGRTETVTRRQLDKLQAAHPNWKTDF